ncbi:MAG: hypothetical protein ACYCOU_02360 [Sulfobacillus sp.]
MIKMWNELTPAEKEGWSVGASLSGKKDKTPPKLNGYHLFSGVLGSLYKGAEKAGHVLPLTTELPLRRQSIVWKAFKSKGIEKSWNEEAQRLSGAGVSKCAEVSAEERLRLEEVLMRQVLEVRDFGVES